MARTAELMAALDRTILEVRNHARLARAAISKHSFQAYHEYRDLIDQYEALDATIRGRLPKLAGDERQHYEDRLLQNERRLLGITVKAAFDTLFALSAISNLPIGTKELFTRELEALNAARLRLRSPEHAGKLPADLEQDLETAQLILLEVMDKAPSLASFDPELPGPAANPRSAPAAKYN